MLLRLLTRKVPVVILELGKRKEKRCHIEIVVSVRIEQESRISHTFCCSIDKSSMHLIKNSILFSRKGVVDECRRS